MNALAHLLMNTIPFPIKATTDNLRGGALQFIYSLKYINFKGGSDKSFLSLWGVEILCVSRQTCPENNLLTAVWNVGFMHFYGTSIFQVALLLSFFERAM